MSKKLAVSKDIDLDLDTPAGSAGYLSGAPDVLPIVWHLVNEERGMMAIESLLEEAGVDPGTVAAAKSLCNLTGGDPEDPEGLAGALTVRFVLDALAREENGIDREEVFPVWEGSVWGGVAAAETARLLSFPGCGSIAAAGMLRHVGGMLEDWKLPKCIVEPIHHFRYPLRAGSYFLATAAVHIGDLASVMNGHEDFLSFIDPKIIDLSGFNTDHYSILRRVLAARSGDIDTLRNLL